MITLKSLMDLGDEFVSRHVLPSEPDWQSLHGETPDDAFPDEEEGADDELSENEAGPIDALRAALTADLQPLGEALAGALQAGDEAAFQAALKKISKRMPEFLDSPELEELMASEFVKALTQDETDES